jgi:protein TonB
MTFDSSDTRELAARRLRYSVVASLLVHLAILWPGNTRVLTRDAPAILHATLKPPPQKPMEPIPTEKPAPRAVAPAPTLDQPASKPRQPVLEQASQDSVPPVTAPTAPPVKPQAAPESAAATNLPPSLPAAAGAADGALMTEASASGEAVDGLRGYRLAVATQARRFKRYPAQAMASGWAGTADIRVEVGRDGRPRAATVARSSGHELLDRAALSMIDAGALRARLPESLRGKAFAVVLPVVFNLDDG